MEDKASLQRQARLPGPGAYALPKPASTLPDSAYMARAPRDQVEKQLLDKQAKMPGPGAYNVALPKRAASAYIPVSERDGAEKAALKRQAALPGPGSYSDPSHEQHRVSNKPGKHAAFGALGSRFDDDSGVGFWEKQSANPGPGWYDTLG